MKIKGKFGFVAGFVCGALLFGSTAAFAAGILAQPKTAAVVIDGRTVDLEGYVIEGSHYFRLRDLSAKLAPGGKDFGVVWDGKGNRVVIDTGRSYDPDERYSPAPAATSGYGTAPKILKPGDVVKTTDGDYTVTAGQLERQAELERHGLEFGKPLAPDAPLPAWQSEWDGYPRVSIPAPTPVRYRGDIRGAAYDSMTVFNSYEVERVIRTIYAYAKNNPSLWQDKNPATNVPNFTIKVEYADDMETGVFYPWENAIVPGEAAVKKKVESTGGGAIFRIYVIDDYNNGKYLDTQYFMK
ncbi:MAG: hypothetical protein LBP73_04105 [Clostridiales Family XIII bacterium]|jgi:signal peptidase I|nr:hypothetical protein [Clostridiales Family XIII bacterium]